MPVGGGPGCRLARDHGLGPSRRIGHFIGPKSAGTPASNLLISAELAQKIIVSFIRDGVSKAGFQRAILGLSGGIDSALVAFLAVEALGAENVIGIRMPYQTSSEGSLSDAQSVIDHLKIEPATIPLTAMG